MWRSTLKRGLQVTLTHVGADIVFESIILTIIVTINPLRQFGRSHHELPDGVHTIFIFKILFYIEGIGTEILLYYGATWYILHIVVS
jgi:hypothetical protein